MSMRQGDRVKTVQAVVGRMLPFELAAPRPERDLLNAS